MKHCQNCTTKVIINYALYAYNRNHIVTIGAAYASNMMLVAIQALKVKGRRVQVRTVHTHT